MITNTISNYLSLFDESFIVSELKRLDSQTTDSRLLNNTNPIVNFLINTCGHKDNKLVIQQTKLVNPNDYLYFNFTSSLLKLLKKEIRKNKKYKKELQKNLFGRTAGPALIAISELTAAGFYKEQGHKIQLNSSSEQGMPDVLMPELDYATDVKSFPNDILMLNDHINDFRKEYKTLFGLLKDTDLLLHVKAADKKLLKKSLNELAEDIKNKAIKTEYPALYATPMSQEYKAADVVIEDRTHNTRIHFQPNWPMDDAIEKFNKLLKKSKVQAGSADKRALTWIWFPGDAKKHSIQMQALRHVFKLHQKVEADPLLDGVVCYSIESENKSKTIVSSDIYGRQLRKYGITQESVNKFLINHAQSNEIIIYR